MTYIHTNAHAGTYMHTHTDSASQLSSNNTVLELGICSVEQSLLTTTHRAQWKNSHQANFFFASFLANKKTMHLNLPACVWCVEACLSKPWGAHRVSYCDACPPPLNLLPHFGMMR